MGSCASCCQGSSNKEHTQAVSVDLFSVLPRDEAHLGPQLPADLFKPLDVHFARNHTITNLLQRYPSRRLPADIVAAIWRHYFERLLLAAASSPAAPAVPAGAVAASSSSSSRASTATASGASAAATLSSAPDGSGASSSSPARNPSLLSPSASAGTPVPPVASDGNASGSSSARYAVPAASDAPSDPHPSELLAVQRLLTDILRFDLRVLKERYDEVLAASLAMPSEAEIAAARDRALDGGGGPGGGGGGGQGANGRRPGPADGFRFNPAPVLAALRLELQRLNSLDLVYLARVALRELHGGVAPPRTQQVAPAAATNLPPHSTGGSADSSGPSAASSTAATATTPQVKRNSAIAPLPASPPGLSSRKESSSVVVAGGGGGGGGDLSPLDKPVLPPLGPAARGGSSTSHLLPPLGNGGGSARGTPRSGSSSNSATAARPSAGAPALAAPAAAASPALLSYPSFALNVDHTLRSLFDRFYRKGFWILFSLNLMHHAACIVAVAEAGANEAAAAVMAGAAGNPGAGTLSSRRSLMAGLGGASKQAHRQQSSARSGRSPVGGSWSERIEAASLANEAEQSARPTLGLSSPSSKGITNPLASSGPAATSSGGKGVGGSAADGSNNTANAPASRRGSRGATAAAGGGGGASSPEHLSRSPTPTLESHQMQQQQQTFTARGSGDGSSGPLLSPKSLSALGQQPSRSPAIGAATASSTGSGSGGSGGPTQRPSISRGGTTLAPIHEPPQPPAASSVFTASGAGTAQQLSPRPSRRGSLSGLGYGSGGSGAPTSSAAAAASAGSPLGSGSSSSGGGTGGSAKKLPPLVIPRNEIGNAVAITGNVATATAAGSYSRSPTMASQAHPSPASLNSSSSALAASMLFGNGGGANVSNAAGPNHRDPHVAHGAAGVGFGGAAPSTSVSRGTAGGSTPESGGGMLNSAPPAHPLSAGGGAFALPSPRRSSGSNNVASSTTTTNHAAGRPPSSARRMANPPVLDQIQEA